MNKLTKLILLALLITLSVAWAIALIHTGRLLESHSIPIMGYGLKAGFFGLLAAIFIAQYSELQKLFDDVINKDLDPDDHFGTIDIFMVLSLGLGMLAAIILFIGVIIGNASGNYSFLSGLVWFSKTPLTVLIVIGILVNLLYFVIMKAGGFLVGITHSITKSAAGFGILAAIVIVYLLYTSDVIKLPKTSDPLASDGTTISVSDTTNKPVREYRALSSNGELRKRKYASKDYLADNGANIDQGDPIDQTIITKKGKIISNKVASNGKVTQIIAPQPD